MASYPAPPSYPTHFQAASSTTNLFHPAPPLQRRPLNPFLGARAHLSLSWLSQQFLALLLVLIAFAFLLASIPTLVKDAKDALNAACQGVEGAASVAVSLPHYAADGINEMNVAAVRAVTDGAGTVIDMALLAVEKVVIFIIDIYRSLFLCLLDLAVHGSLTVLVNGLEEAQEFIQDAIGGVRTAIQDSIQGIETALNKTVELIDKIPGVDISLPSLDVPELSALENVTLPTTLVDALTSLNSSIPTYEQLKEQLDTMISTPIEALRTEVNSTFTNASSLISVELLPVPAKQSIEICQDLDTGWVNDVGDDLAKVVKIMIGLVVLAMGLWIVGCALWERYSYRVFLGGVDAARQAWLADLLSSSSASTAAAGPHPHSSVAESTLSTPNLLSFLNASSHPTLFRHLRRLQSLLRLRTSHAKAQLVWFLSYIAHPYAWAFLALGLVGLVVVQIQLAVLEGPVKSLVHRRAEQGAGEFSTSVVGALNDKWNETSTEWAEGTNKVILGLQDTINDDVFSWVNTTTTSINSTINTFYTGITDGLTDVFNGTVLEDPVLDLVYCILGSKVDALSSALTWLHSHAHLSLPTVSPSVLLLSPDRSAELTDSLTSPNSSYSAPSVADKMLDAYRRSLEQQRMGFCVAVGIWGLVLLMGVVGLVWRERESKRPLVGDEEEKDEAAQGGEDEKRFFFSSSSGGVGSRLKLKPLHLRSASASAFFHPSSSSRRAAAAAEGEDEPPSPAYALFPQPGESTAYPPPPPGPHAREGDPYGSTRSWASLVDFFRPSDSAPTAEGASKEGGRKPISLPRPARSSGFAPSFFPAASSKAKLAMTGSREKLDRRVRELRGRVEERREERRRRRRGEEREWVRMDEAQDEGDGERRGGGRGPPSSPPPRVPLPPLPDSPVPPVLRLANPFSDPLFSPSSPPPPLPLRNPFLDPLSSPPPTLNPFSTSTSTSALPYEARPVVPFGPPTGEGGEGGEGGGRNPFADPAGGGRVGRAV
ncbi:hypothetical protein JCM8097_006146 [Rhodosporidiobolus ruineniae]